MSELSETGWNNVLCDDLKTHSDDYFKGKIRRPCDDDYSNDCNGEHNYELPLEYPRFFK